MASNYPSLLLLDLLVSVRVAYVCALTHTFISKVNVICHH